MFGNFFIKKLMQSKMKDVPEAERERILSTLDSNPELFENIMKEAEARIRSGENQMEAVQAVIEKYGDEVKDAFGDKA